jgi:PAS domain S-box-containing protein
MSEQLRTEELLNSISDSYFAMDDQYTITYWNRAAEIGTGLRAPEVVGKNVYEIFPQARHATLGEKYRLAMETRTFQSFETAYKDERFEAWYDVRIHPSDNGISVFFQDITTRKHEQRQKEFLAEVSRAVNTSRQLDQLCQSTAAVVARLVEVPERLVCLYLFDARQNEIRLVAPALLDMDFPEHVVHQSVTADAETLVSRAAFTRVLQLGSNIAGGTVGVLHDPALDALHPRSLLAIPLLVQGDLQGVLEVLSMKDAEYVQDELEILSTVADDIAVGISRKRLIDELRMKNLELESQTQKTVEASDALKRFLAMFSHELRSPLNSIIGFSDLLGSQLQELTPDTVQDFMRNINASGKYLQQIINDILDLSKIEAGKMDLHVASYPVAYFRDAVERVLAAAIQEKQIKLSFEMDPDIDELVVDQTRFKQVLVNLVSNAVKFSHEEGTVTVRSERQGNDLLFSVCDFGTGIRPEEIPGLFKAFGQAQSGKGRNKQGIGLGLAITKKLIELHGGTIAVHSEWGKGTTVSFKIPMVVDATSERIMQAGMLLDALHREHWRREGGEKPLALIVEDSAPASELLRVHVESAGYRVEVARNGDDAVEMAKSLHPHVITLDLFLPGKDGWQVLNELKRHPLCKQIPVIIVSIIEEKTLAFSLGAVDYFVKPVTREELVQALDRVHLPPVAGDRKPTVLVIDDDRAATDLVQIILENEGYRVLKAFQGKDGIETAVHEHPDVVILDLIMPEMSGFEVAYQLKQVPATRTIPIIVLTSMDVSDEDIQAQLGAYVTGLVSKATFTKKDLLREIANIENARWP